MYEVLVIECADDAQNIPALATWTEVFATYDEALNYKECVIFDEPLSYTRAAVTTLITNLHVTERAGLLEVRP
jgi:hypothetical protein